MADRGPVFPVGASPLGASSDPRPCSPLRGCMDYDVVEEECWPVFPVRPGAKQTRSPISGSRSASTGGSSGCGDTADPPQLSLGSETVSRETDERNGQFCDGVC